MGKVTMFSLEVRERAVRLVDEQADGDRSQDSFRQLEGENKCGIHKDSKHRS
jgi:hypothetical protein